jgi:orotate phosphoribosyltransferase
MPNRNPDIVIDHDDHLETLRRCGGYYVCPKDKSGKRLGPLVGYAGDYDAGDGTRKKFVGDVYANFAKAEEYPRVMYYFTESLAEMLKDAFHGLRDDILCGTPLGGYSLAGNLSMVLGCRVIKAEKEVIAIKTETSREKTKLVFARHSIEKGENYIIVEDVCNNFSTTDQLIALIMSLGGNVSIITSFLNRSPDVDEYYESKVAGKQIPIVSLVRYPIMEYRQDDPEVINDLKDGNIIWKPKDEWYRLDEAMSASR